jgi:hypothetical protein
MSFINFEGQTARWLQRLKEYTSLPSTVRAENTTMSMPSPDDHAEKSVLTEIKSRSGQKSIR